MAHTVENSPCICGKGAFVFHKDADGITWVCTFCSNHFAMIDCSYCGWKWYGNCSDCRGGYLMYSYACRTIVCNKCGNHEDLALCFCGWNITISWLPLQ